MAVTLSYFTEFGKLALQKTICGWIYARVYCVLVRVKCRRKESSRSLSHLLMSFLSSLLKILVALLCETKVLKCCSCSTNPWWQSCAELLWELCQLSTELCVDCGDDVPPLWLLYCSSACTLTIIIIIIINEFHRDASLKQNFRAAVNPSCHIRFSQLMTYNVLIRVTLSQRCCSWAVYTVAMMINASRMLIMDCSTEGVNESAMI